MIQPLADKIMVVEKDPLEKTDGGLLIPETAKTRQLVGTILTIGKGKARPVGLKIGETVMFGKYAGMAEKHKLNGVEFIIMEEQDVLGVLNDGSLSPFWDRLLVRPIYPDEQKSLGIFLTDADFGDCGCGEVVAAGPGLPLDCGEISPMNVNIGDRIFFKKKDGVSIKLNGEFFLVMKDVDVLAVQE